MRFCLLSDLHLEFGDYEWPDPNTYDWLILAGDICSWQSSARKSLDDYIDLIEKKGKKIIYVPGNHEYYNGCIDDRYTDNRDDGRGLCAEVHSPGISFYGLFSGEKRIYIVSNIMWTDFNGGNEEDMRRAASRMNDYRFISKVRGGELITPQDTLEINTEFKESLEFFLSLKKEPEYETIVVTHHSPLEHQPEEGWGMEGRSNDASYVCSWAKDIIRNNKIDVWCHGHTHVARDFMYEGTRILSNPRGYMMHLGSTSGQVKGFKPEGLIFELGGVE
jgi:predicted phosphodiesterase